jgi:hypothetical protein
MIDVNIDIHPDAGTGYQMANVHTGINVVTTTHPFVRTAYGRKNASMILASIFTSQEP